MRRVFIYFCFLIPFVATAEGLQTTTSHKKLGNGSIGVGKGNVEITTGLFSMFTGEVAYVENDLLRDKRSNEVIFKIRKLDALECQQENSQSVKMTLGNTAAYEYRPEYRGRVPEPSQERNRWTVQSKNGCVQLIPVSTHNVLQQIVLGTLNEF